jgi:hypothetical protein
MWRLGLRETAKRGRLLKNLELRRKKKAVVAVVVDANYCFV